MSQITAQLINNYFHQIQLQFQHIQLDEQSILDNLISKPMQKKMISKVMIIPTAESKAAEESPVEQVLDTLVTRHLKKSLLEYTQTNEQEPQKLNYPQSSISRGITREIMKNKQCLKRQKQQDDHKEDVPKAKNYLKIQQMQNAPRKDRITTQYKAVTRTSDLQETVKITNL